MDTNILSTGAILAGAGTVAWGLVSQLKSVPKFIYNKIRRSVVYTVKIYQYDSLFEILESWLCSYHPKAYKEVEAVSKPSKSTVKSWFKPYMKGGMLYNQRIDSKERLIEYKQEDNTFIIKYKGKKLLIIKDKEKLDKAQSLKEIYFRKYTISGWGAKKQIDELLNEAIELSIANEPKDKVCIYSNTQYGDWQSLGTKRVKGVDKTILSPFTKQLIINDVERFVNSEDWYANTSIAYKRGYCFYGPPGTGKTTLALALASYTGRSIYTFNLNSIEDDSRIPRAFAEIEENSILLVEDIDRVFTGRENVKENSKITFSCFLNCIDGAFSKHGLITIITTNHIDKLDEALLRTGRMDVKVEIPLPTDREISAYLSLFFNEQIEIFGKFELKMSDVQELCLQNREDASAAIRDIYTHKKLNGKLICKELA